jgi:hypothetical protein
MSVAPLVLTGRLAERGAANPSRTREVQYLAIAGNMICPFAPSLEAL